MAIQQRPSSVMIGNRSSEQLQKIQSEFSKPLRTYTVVTEYCLDTGLYVGYIPEFPGAHSQGETLEELKDNFHEVITMLLNDDSVRVVFN